MAVVEFAILAMLLVTVLLGASEFGRAMYQYDTLVKSARAATRYLAQYPPGDAAAHAVARNIAVYGSTSPLAQSLVPDLSTLNVTVCDASNCPASHMRQASGRGSVGLVTVSLTGVRFQSLAPWVLGNITFGTISATMPQGAGL